MNLPVVLRPEASRDVEQARDYYESQHDGLGQAFLDRLKESLLRIADLPETYAIVWRNVRAARLRQFAYVVYYRMHKDRIEILAVVHGSRGAATWKSRV